METKSGVRTPSPAPSALDAHLGFWMRYVSNGVSARFAGLLESRGSSVTEWVALRTLFDSRQATHAALIQALGMTKGATSKIISRLEAKGLVRRRAAEGSGREQVLVLTRKGADLVPRLAALADENDAHFFGHLPASQRASLMRVCMALVEHHRLKGPPVS